MILNIKDDRYLVLLYDKKAKQYVEIWFEKNKDTLERMVQYKKKQYDSLFIDDLELCVLKFYEKGMILVSKMELKVFNVDVAFNNDNSAVFMKEECVEVEKDGTKK